MPIRIVSENTDFQIPSIEHGRRIRVTVTVSGCVSIDFWPPPGSGHAVAAAESSDMAERSSRLDAGRTSNA
jgi:hypothetical protein